MRLTGRCRELLKLLRCARWLTTGQLRRRFFGKATEDAARKRLRLLTNAGYLVKVQPDRTREALFTLGCEGKRLLEKAGQGEIVIERRPPKQLEHFMAVNDFRIAVELVGSVAYFFAYWELPTIGWRYPVIPDAVLALNDRTFAVEVDRGMEGIRYFLRTKIAHYSRGLDGLPLAAVLIITDRTTRTKSLAKAIGYERGRFLYTTLELIRSSDLSSPIFNDGAEKLDISIFQKPLFSNSLVDKRVFSSHASESKSIR